MRLQEIRHPSTNTTRFAPSMDEARKVRQSLVDEFKFRKMDVSIEDAEVASKLFVAHLPFKKPFSFADDLLYPTNAGTGRRREWRHLPQDCIEFWRHATFRSLLGTVASRAPGITSSSISCESYGKSAVTSRGFLLAVLKSLRVQV